MENSSPENGPEVNEPILKALDESSLEKEPWDTENSSPEVSFADSSMTAGTWHFQKPRVYELFPPEESESGAFTAPGAMTAQEISAHCY